MFTENIILVFFLPGINVERFTGDSKEMPTDVVCRGEKMFFMAEQFITLFEKSENRKCDQGGTKNPSSELTKDGFLLVKSGTSGCLFNYNAISFSITCLPL
ncbi:hypothetical protein [Draconibacterium sp.]